jgi:hypothetical protein
LSAVEAQALVLDHQIEPQHLGGIPPKLGHHRLVALGGGIGQAVAVESLAASVIDEVLGDAQPRAARDVVDHVLGAGSQVQDFQNKVRAFALDRHHPAVSLTRRDVEGHEEIGREPGGPRVIDRQVAADIDAALEAVPVVAQGLPQHHAGDAVGVALRHGVLFFFGRHGGGQGVHRGLALGGGQRFPLLHGRRLGRKPVDALGQAHGHTSGQAVMIGFEVPSVKARAA